MIWPSAPIQAVTARPARNQWRQVAPKPRRNRTASWPGSSAMRPSVRSGDGARRPRESRRLDRRWCSPVISAQARPCPRQGVCGFGCSRREIGFEDPPELSLVQSDDIVQTFPSDRTDHTFDVSILPRRSRGGRHLSDRHRCNVFAESPAVGAVPISNEKPRCRVPWKGLGNLSSRPFRCRVGGDAEMHDAPPFVAQDDKHKEELERDCGNHEEIDRSRTIHVIAEEYLPTLIGIPGTAGHVLGHRGLTDLEAELQEFPVDARRAPQGIVRAHPPDERPKLAAHLGPPSARSRLPAPIDPEPLTMPAHQCLRMHNSDRWGDPRPKAKDQSEYEAIGPGQSYSLRR